MPKKRVLWLFNHCTLIKSEVPILKELGYEIFIPKIPPFDGSIAVDWSYDKDLTIPEEKLDVLNSVDFYYSKIPSDAMEIMNEYFDMVIFGMFIEPLKSLVLHFNGKLVFHPFGLFNGYSYTNEIISSGGVWLIEKIEQLGKRFWFGQSYDNLYEVECDFFKSRAINLPIGMMDTTIQDCWNGSKKKVLFVCPRIKVSGYFNSIYKKFKKDFEKIPYSIAGVQIIPVDEDENVVGYLPKEEYDAFYPAHSCMFYHSQEKRHIHYHPFEAIKCGLPLIFMEGGMLDKLGGSNLPGRCKTIKEARKKCKRIIKGDKKFAEKVRTSQKILLEAMAYEKCCKTWKDSMKIVEKSVDVARVNKHNKLAIILPEPYKGGLFDYTVNLLNILKTGSELNMDPLDIVFYYKEELYREYIEVFEDLENRGIALRTFEWEKVDANRIRNYAFLSGKEYKLYEQEYHILNDGIRYLEDCDYLLFMVDRVPPNLFLTKPYGVVVHDYIQRYIPNMFEKYYEKPFIDLVRNSQANFTTTLCTLEDGVQYAGARRDRFHLIPLFFNDINKLATQVAMKEKAYFMWSTNISPHKNHIMALKALELYYSLGGTLECYITGVFTDLFDNNVTLEDKELAQVQIDYLNKCRNIIKRNKNLLKFLHFEGNLPKKEYYSLLNGAQFLIHPGFADNGNGSAVDAALLGVPTLSSDYPAMRNMEENMELGITFFDKSKYESLAELLLYCENNINRLKSRLPEANELKKYTIKNPQLCDSIYNKIRRYIEI